jgi:hypothetical protein
MLLQFETLDPTTTSIRVTHPVVESVHALEMVQEYTSYILAQPPKQNVHVRVDPAVIVRWEQLVQIYTSIRRFHKKHDLIDSVHLYISDKLTVQWVRALINMFGSSVPFNIVHAPPPERSAPAR